jgi:hypothetical protein
LKQKNIDDEEDDETTTHHDHAPDTTTTAITEDHSKKTDNIPPWSNVVIPFPFLRNDEDETLRQTRTPASRRMPYREQVLERHGLPCEFEVNLDIAPVQWTLHQLRTLLRHKWKDYKRLDPGSSP